MKHNGHWHCDKCGKMLSEDHSIEVWVQHIKQGLCQNCFWRWQDEISVAKIAFMKNTHPPKED